MLQIKDIRKQYTTGELVQTALDDVSLNLRDNEFVAVLGPSGSGKTTLLNIIGGLDRYDSGDLVINGISTKKYKDRDWDSYRNHTIGFVFQSYNLIPHQTILSNVELALTISGVSRAERKRRAMDALTKVGLGDQLHKKPNQMSGGQMQRVAIARALVNDPDILLADEPTGALDSETSVQVLDLLREVASDRLVVMVTHNSELAEEYANRIVKLRDGKIIGDSNPYELDDAVLEAPKHKNMGKASMSFLTSLSLSFNNLRTKKGRTILTAFAGSIGIIGIALILSLSTGVNAYIASIQKDTMSSYPIQIEAQTMDLSSLLSQGSSVGFGQNLNERTHNLDAVYSNSSGLERASRMSVSITTNNLTEFKKYLDNPDSAIHEYLGINGIVYSYDVKFDVYARDPDGTLVNTDGSTFDSDSSGTASSVSVTNGMGDMGGDMSVSASASTGGMSDMGGMGGFLSGSGNFEELLPGAGDKLISESVTDSYSVIYGNWPQKYDELVIILDKNNEISSSALYELGLLPASEYKAILKKLGSGEEIEITDHSFSYADICAQSFYMIPACDYYVENADGLYVNVAGDKGELEKLLENCVELKVVGVARVNEDASYTSISGSVGYTKALTDYLIDYTRSSPVVKAQEADADINVITGEGFEPDTESYDDNMTAFGVISLDAPSAINLYADNFENKDSIATCIEDYNKTVDEDDQISYTDLVELLMSSVTSIINVISYVLIAFVAVSLVVSSIMIGIITFISVLERTKEIGILRAIGASKANISQVFNAETFIVGFLAGLIGIGLSLLIMIPGNIIIHAITGSNDINASLPLISAALLVVLSMGLTLIAGLLPSRAAAKKDPVIALRTE